MLPVGRRRARALDGPSLCQNQNESTNFESGASGLWVRKIIAKWRESGL